MIFDSLNNAAQKKQSELSLKKRQEEQLQKNIAEQEETAFINHLVDYLTPYIEQTANDVITHNGDKRERYVHINDIIFGYPKTPYIREHYKSKYDEPIYCFLWHVETNVKAIFQEKLPAFQIDLVSRRENGFLRADHQIRITMQFKKQP